jgi:hypothetical protein
MSFFAALAKAALSGVEKKVEETIVGKIESMGEDLIKELIGSTPLGEGLEFSKRFSEAIETHGASEFKEMRDAWLNSLMPTPLPHSTLVNKFTTAFNNGAQAASRPKGYWKWSKSRKQWLDENWRHDWHSQPRDSRGRWIPGRLNYIYVSKKLKKIRRRNRKIGRQYVKDIFRGD